MCAQAPPLPTYPRSEVDTDWRKPLDDEIELTRICWSWYVPCCSTQDTDRIIGTVREPRGFTTTSSCGSFVRTARRHRAYGDACDVVKAPPIPPLPPWKGLKQDLHSRRWSERCRTTRPLYREACRHWLEGCRRGGSSQMPPSLPVAVRVHLQVCGPRC
jgi:hypothetical protein